MERFNKFGYYTRAALNSSKEVKHKHMKKLYLRIVETVGKLYKNKIDEEVHIKSIPYSSIVHPKTTTEICRYYPNHSSNLEKHCHEMKCDGHTLYFCFTQKINHKPSDR